MSLKSHQDSKSSPNLSFACYSFYLVDLFPFMNTIKNVGKISSTNSPYHIHYSKNLDLIKQRFKKYIISTLCFETYQNYISILSRDSKYYFI